MTKEELVRGCMTVIEKLPEFDCADDVMIEGVRAALPIKTWIEASPEGKEEYKRELYRALKAGFQVKDVDDHLVREDLELLDASIAILENPEEYDAIEDPVAHAIELLKKVREL